MIGLMIKKKREREREEEEEEEKGLSFYVIFKKHNTVYS